MPVHSSGFRSIATATVCWLAGTCFSASSLVHLNINLGLSTLMLMVFPVSVASVCGRIVRLRHRTLVLSKPDQLRSWRTNLLPNWRWGDSMDSDFPSVWPVSAARLFGYATGRWYCPNRINFGAGRPNFCRIGDGGLHGLGFGFRNFWAKTWVAATHLDQVTGDPQGGGGGVLTYMFSIGMCRGKDPPFLT